MKKWKYFVMLFATLALLAVPAYAEEMDAEDVEPVGAEDVEPVEDVSEEAEPEEEAEEAVSAEPEDMPAAVELVAEGVADLFQCGSLTGTYTMPDEVSLFEEDKDYNLIYECLKNRKTDVTLTFTASGDFRDRVKAYFEKVVNDHPELFYVDNYYTTSWPIYSNGTTGPVIFKPAYLSFTEADVAKFNAKVAEIANSARQFTTPLEQMLYVHEYLAVNCAYNWDVAVTGGSGGQNAHNAYGILIEGDAVCQGYALAYKLVLDELGLNCVTVSSDSMNHMWNLVQLDGNWYHVDVTWDDPVVDVQGRVMHNYFLLSDTAISDEDHAHKNWITSVKCTNQKYESGYIFSTFSQASRIIRPIYFEDGRYYYIRGDSTGRLYSSGSLSIPSTGETPIATFNTPTSWNGMVWLDDMLFYVNNKKEIMQYNLTSRESASLGTVTFTAQTVTSGKGTFEDGIGLRYDSSSGQIIASSATRRSDLGRFNILKYPPEWKKETETKILGLAYDQKSVGVKCNTPNSTFWVAYYQNGKFVKAELHQLTSTEFQLVELGTPPAGYTGMRLMLTNASYTPECAAYPVEK